MSEAKLEEWVQLALKDEDISNYTIALDGTTGKGDGYLGNIFFVSVTGKDKRRFTKKINLVIKVSKENEKLRKQAPIKEAFKKEIFVYNRILPEFNIFQKEMGTKNLLNFIPHYYASRICNGSEVLILEDLRVRGFSTCDRKSTLNQDHVRLILEAYGKWHAFSFTLKRKKRHVFEELVKDNINVYSWFFVKTGLVELTLDNLVQARDACISKDEVELLEKLQFSLSDANYILTDLYYDDPEYRVITHADCWTNNFIFNKDKDVTKPLSVIVLDWQDACFSSPVFDLSHFIYLCVDTATCKDVSPLLKIYHKSLSDTLECLGCNPEELFSYSKLVEHWKRFSRFGIFIQSFLVKFTICDTETVPDFVETAEQGKDFIDNFYIEISDKEVYYKRVRANFIHYVRNLNISDEK